MLLSQLRGLDKTLMEDLAESFYREVIRPNYIAQVINAVKKCKHENYKLYIVSGGYDIYIRHVAQEFGFDDIICTTLQFDGQKFTGRYKGDDCMKTNKLRMLRKYFNRENLHDINSVAYSDSSSDIPMLRFTRRGIVVKKLCPPPLRYFYVMLIIGSMLTASRCSHGKDNKHSDSRHQKE